MKNSSVLSDGTAVGSLIDEDLREVDLRIFADEEIYQLELEKLWAKNWIVLGHESEIPEAGDFVTRKFGDDSVILVRQRDGGIKCLLNVCPHRGTTVCREEAGNGSVFRCIYHGWVFNLDGKFRGLPFKEEMYPDGYDENRMGLLEAQVEIFAGIIFVNWDKSAAPLDDYLGGFKWYLNLMFNRSKNGMEVLGPPQRFVMNANWKSPAEQFAGDGSHANQLHRSLALLTGGDLNNPRDFQMHAPKVGTDNGHNVICFDMRDIYKKISPEKDLSVAEKLNAIPTSGVPVELVPEVLEQFSDEELALLADTPPGNGSIFPNCAVWNMNNPLPDGSPGPFLSFRTYVPVGVNKFEFCMWVLVAKDSPPEYRETMRRATSFSQGASGFIEGDDAEVWPGQANAAKGYMGRQLSMKFWAKSSTDKPDGWAGPDEVPVYTGFLRDDTQWNWWKTYFKNMTLEK